MSASDRPPDPNPTPMESVRIEPDGRGCWVLTAEQWLPRPVEAVFPFFAEAGNLDAITPPWLRFRIVTPRPIGMREGALIDYALRVRGLPMRWRSRITVWDPPRRFVDEQVGGPYRLWRHEHTFEPRAGGTLVRDRVQYAVPLGSTFIGRAAHAIMVRNDLEKIFAHRCAVLRGLFGHEAAAGGAPDPSPAARAPGALSP